MDTHTSILGILAVLLLVSVASASNTTNIRYYCPSIICTDTNFAIWADYEFNNTDITDEGNVTVSNTSHLYHLVYNSSYEKYREIFSSADEFTWNYTLDFFNNQSYTNFSRNCSTTFIDCYNLTVVIWEEQEYKTKINTTEFIVRVKNYDKTFDDPYINNFASIVAVYHDLSIAGVSNESCNLPVGSVQKATELLNYGDWMGGSLTNLFQEDYGHLINCDHLWFRGGYSNGEAILHLPYIGNYTLFLIDGTMTWTNQYSPPTIVKSDLFLPLGEITVQNRQHTTIEFYLEHKDLNWWSSFTQTFYIWAITFFALFILIILIIAGIPFKYSMAITLLWIILWTILRML